MTSVLVLWAALLAAGEDASGEELARRVAAAQGIRALQGGLKDFTLECDVIVTNGENRVSGKAVQVFKAPGRLFMSFEDSLEPGKKIERSFDGKHYWAREAGQVVPLRGDRYRKDREDLDRNARLVSFFAEIYFLTGDREVRYERLPDRKRGSRGLRALRRTEGAREPVLLLVDGEKDHLVEVEVPAGRLGPERIRIELGGHAPMGDFLVPVRVKVFAADAEDPELKAHLRSVRVNTDPPDAMFSAR